MNSSYLSIREADCIGNDENEDDGEWHQQLLQRTGIIVLTALEKSGEEAALRDK